MKRYIFTVLLLCALALPLAAQVVHIPDPNLRAAVRETLNLPRWPASSRVMPCSN